MRELTAVEDRTIATASLVFSANEQAWVVGYYRTFSELMIVDGLR